MRIDRAGHPCLREEDAELADRLRVAFILSLSWLNYWETAGRAGRRLTSSSIGPLRTIGLTVLALVRSFEGAEAAYPQLTRAQSELDNAVATSQGLNTNIAAGMIPWIRARIAGQTGDFETALSSTQEFLASEIAADHYTTGTTRAAKHKAACQVLLGDPASALENVARLKSFGVSSVDGEEVRALAYLALGDVASAEEVIRTHAERALTGRLTGELVTPPSRLPRSPRDKARWTPPATCCCTSAWASSQPR